MREALSTRIQLIDLDDCDDPRVLQLQSRLHVHAKMGPTPPKEWLAQDFIGAGDLVVMYGAPECGKTALAVDMACRFAAGVDWNGEETESRHGVLYVASERAGQVRRRVDAFCTEHRFEPLDNLLIFDGDIDLSDGSDDLTSILHLARYGSGDDISIDLVIIDTLSASMSGSDANPETMAAAVRSIKTAMRSGDDREAGALVIHHVPASGEARMRGAGQLLGAADTTIHVTKSRGVSTAKVVKNNDTPGRVSLSYSMKSVVVAIADDDSETTAAVIVPVGGEPETAPRSDKMPVAVRRAVSVLSEAVAAHGGPVTPVQLRERSDAAAGEISPDAKRKRFERLLQALDGSSLLSKVDGKLSVNSDKDRTGQDRTLSEDEILSSLDRTP